MNKIEKNVNKFKSISEDEELANHWKSTYDYRHDFEKSEKLSTKISNFYKFFKLFNNLNKKSHKNRFTRQFNLDYIKFRHNAIMQAINFVKLNPHDDANLKVLRDEARKKNAIEHVWEVENRQLEVPDVKDESKFIKTTARNKVKVKIDMENCTKPLKC